MGNCGMDGPIGQGVNETWWQKIKRKVYNRFWPWSERFLKRSKTMHIGHLLFKTNGRISRKIWWLTQIGLWVGVAITGWLWQKYGFHDAVFGFIGTAIMFWIRVNVNVKRLHDVGLSGWWLALFESCPVIGILLFGMGFGFIIPAAVVVGGYLAGFITLGFIKGNKEANEHGEPLA